VANKLTLQQRNLSENSVEPVVVSVLSGKGGVGKSVVAYNLSCALASFGQRVLIVDADLNFGNVHILANSRCTYGINQFISGELGLKEAVTALDKNFDLLAACGDRAVIQDGDITPIGRMMKQLRKQGQNYNFIVIDHASGVSKTSTVLAHASDINLLLLVPELTSISDCYGLFKHLKAADKAIDCRILVNRAQSQEEADHVYAKICAVSERFLRSYPGYAGFIPEHSDVRRALAGQHPLATVNAQSPVVQALNTLAASIGANPRRMQLFTPNTINKTTAPADIRG